MTYRDDREAQHARIERLEGEIAAANAKIARLEGRAGDASGTKPSRLIGMPRHFVLERELPFEVSDAGYESIAETLRQRFPMRAPPSQVGRTLTHGILPGLLFRVTRLGPGRTLVRAEVDHGGNGAGLIVLTPGTTILALMPLAVALKGLRASPGYLVAVIPVVAVACFFALRALLKRSAYATQARVSAAMDEVTELAEQNARRERVRVSAGESDEALKAERADTATVGSAARSRGQ